MCFDFEHWICSSGSTDKDTRSVLFGNAEPILDLNTGFALVVKTLPDGIFSSIWVNREEIRTLFDS